MKSVRKDLIESDLFDAQTEIVCVGLLRFDEILLIAFHETVAESVLQHVDVHIGESVFRKFVDVLRFVEVLSGIRTHRDVEFFLPSFDHKRMGGRRDFRPGDVGLLAMFLRTDVFVLIGDILMVYGDQV